MSSGGGCEILNGYEFGSEPYLVEIGDNVRITRGVNITTTMAAYGFSVTFILSSPMLIVLQG